MVKEFDLFESNPDCRLNGCPGSHLEWRCNTTLHRFRIGVTSCQGRSKRVGQSQMVSACSSILTLRHQHRYTSLDRMIKRDAGKPEEAGLPFFTVTKRPGAGLRRRPLAEQHTAERLRVLESMGLAENTGPGTRRVRQEFESILRAMQRSADRQKMLAAHGALMSDERLPPAVLDFRRFTSLEGRILVHGEEDTGRQAGRSYLMLEATDGQVHYIYYTPEMEEARSRGGLRTNSFVRLRKRFSEGHPALKIEELGDSKSILRNKRFLREPVQHLIGRGIATEEAGWNGWLGRYHRALHEAATTLEHKRLRKRVEFKKDRSRGL
jgi:hypothetical protein